MKKLLKKWIGGTATWEEEKQLRRGTGQDDFLAEAMEGYDAFPMGNHASKIRDLKSRLPNQKRQDRSPLIYLTRVAAAAAIIGVIGIFIWVNNEVNTDATLSMENSKVELPIVKEEVAHNIPSPTISADNQEATNDNKLEQSPNSSPIANPNPEKKKPSPAINKPAAPTNTPKLTRPSSEGIAENEVDQINADLVTSTAPSVIESDPPIEMDGIPTPSNVPPVIAEPTDNNVVFTDATIEKEAAAAEKKRKSEVKAKERPSNFTDAARTSRKMTEPVPAKVEMEASPIAAAPNSTVVERVNYYVGTVKNEDGQPMDQVKVIGLSTDFKTITDLSGDFVITTKEPLNKIVVSRDGFHTRNISINQYTDFLNVVLTKKSTTIPREDYVDIETIAPRPQNGFVDFFTYLDNNLQYPTKAKAENIEREIEVRFYIDESGTPTNIKATHPDRFGFDKEAIRLLENGPKWEPNNTYARYYVTFELE